MEFLHWSTYGTFINVLHNLLPKTRDINSWKMGPFEKVNDFRIHWHVEISRKAPPRQDPFRERVSSVSRVRSIPFLVNENIWSRLGRRRGGGGGGGGGGGRSRTQEGFYSRSIKDSGGRRGIRRIISNPQMRSSWVRYARRRYYMKLFLASYIIFAVPFITRISA